MFDLILKNAKLVTPRGIKEGDLGVSGGKIVKIGMLTEKATTERDCTGLFVLPGAIDMHVHFRDPGFAEKEDFETGSAAALAGGVTTVIDMPNTNPPITTCEALEEKRKIAAAKSHVNYGFYFGFTGNNLDEIKNAKNIAGVKVFTAASNASLFVPDHHLIEKLFELGKLVIVHAEKESIIRENAAKYLYAQDPRVHSLIRSPRAAFEEVKEILHCAKKCNGRVHITHVSTKQEVDELRKFHGPLVSGDCTPHHLYLTEKAYDEHGNFVKVNPPLRSEEDRETLWKGLKEDHLQAVATDHAPHLREEKKQPYTQAPSGVPGLETFLPLLLDSVNHGELNLEQVALFTAENPAKILGIRNKGRIEEGYDADLIIVDMQKKMEVPKSGFFTKCNWSPFSGQQVQGWPVLTIVSGVIGFENRKINKDCRGKEIVLG